MADEQQRPVHPDERRATTAMLKAYAHPLRRRITRAVAARGHARAADLAAALGVPANSVSFHLRVLANAGLLEEDPEHARDKRDRVWKTTEGAWTLGSPEHPVEDEVLATSVMGELAEDHLALLRRVIAWSGEYISGRETAQHGTWAQRTLHLTEAEFRQLETRINDVITEATEAHDPDDPDTRFWNLDIIGADDTI